MKPKLHSKIALLLLSSLVVGCGGGESWPDVVLDPSYYTNKYSYDQEADSFLGRGINMGNYLEADETPGCQYDGEGCWTGGRLIQERDFTLIKAAGFKTVRIPVRWSDHTGAADPYTVEAAWMDRVQQVVDWALAADLKVVLNTHHYTEMMDDPPASLPGHRARLAAIWDQISVAFPIEDYPVDSLVFELLNEPNGTVGYPEWNGIIAELTTVIWTDNAATQAGRKIMVGTANWGGPDGLDSLSLPDECDDTNTIITIHWYRPMEFTHQGAEWVRGSQAWIGTTWIGTSAEQQPLLSLYDSVTTWNAQPGRGFEIFVGEFGVYAKHARAEYRKAWTAFIAREAEARAMSWAYWEFDQGFGAYNRGAGDWRPEIIEALLPPDAPPPD